MPRTDPGFLGETERRLIDAIATSVDESPPTSKESTNRLDEFSNPDQRKSDIKRGPGSADDLPKILLTVWADLRRIEQFHQTVRTDQPGGQWEFYDQILPEAEEELRSLHEYTGYLLQQVEQSPQEYVRQELAEALTPLTQGLPAFQQALADGLPNENSDTSEQESTEMSAGLVADVEEMTARREALTAILKDAALREEFEWIADNEGKKIPKKREKDGYSSRWWVSKKLDTDLGLVVEDDQWDDIYSLTSRGEAVLATWKNLRDSPLVPETNIDPDLAALQLLSHHFDGVGWPDLEDIPSASPGSSETDISTGDQAGRVAERKKAEYEEIVAAFNPEKSGDSE